MTFPPILVPTHFVPTSQMQGQPLPKMEGRPVSLKFWTIHLTIPNFRFDQVPPLLPPQQRSPVSMARTKQRARKSTGGEAPRKQLELELAGSKSPNRRLVKLLAFLESFIQAAAGGVQN